MKLLDLHHVWAIAKKELRGYFHSPVALLFLGTFVASTLFLVLWHEKFFARGIADVRPLFEWLPILLIFLVAALTMRLWSEEQKVGTIEILLTLPIRLHELVLGKFLAGFLLIALALGMTLGLPITVALTGDIDWGPVVGGYFAALLLAATYLAIGLCVSSSTDNQIVSLVSTVVLCALLYLPGAAAVTGATGYEVGEFLRSLGTGSRFDSIARGVIDLRDLAYWGGLVVFFLAVNTVMLRAKRWSAGKRTFAARQATKIMVVLLAFNIVALNAWVSPVARARIDLTAGKRYSLSPVTKDLLRALDEPLLIRGYFSRESHEKLAPLVPEIRDLFEEYRIAGGGRVRIEMVDPTDDVELQREALDLYNIEPRALPLVSRLRRGVVNTYFHVVVQYGDSHEVVELGSMIEVRWNADHSDVEVVLGNVEYQITKAAKKLAYGFESIDALLSSMSEEAVLTLMVSPDQLPPTLAGVAATMEKVAQELARDSGGSLRFEKVEPEGLAEGRMATFHGYQVPPRQVLGPDGIRTFYFHPLLKLGDRIAMVELPQEDREDRIREALENALMRVAPGFLKTVGLYTPPPVATPPPVPGMQPGQPEPPQSFRQLRERLDESYEIHTVTLAGPIDDAIDVLILAAPQTIGEEGRRAIDQFLMRGGSVIVLAGRYGVDRQALRQRSLGVTPVTTGLEEMLAHYGVTVDSKLVADARSASFDIPVRRDLGDGRQIVEIRQLPYPFFVRVRGDGLASDHLTTGGIPGLLFEYASPLEVEERLLADGGDDRPLRAEVLARSSDAGWLQSHGNVVPDLARHPEVGFDVPSPIPEGARGPHPLAVALVGTFDSYFARDDGEGAGAGGEDGASLLRASPPETRLVVIGSSAFVSDEGLSLGFQAVDEEVIANLQFIQNLVDWSLEDTDLLTIRNRGRARFLEVEEDKRRHWEIINYGIAFFALALVIGVSFLRRRALEPMELFPPDGGDLDAPTPPASSDAALAGPAVVDDDLDDPDDDPDDDLDDDLDDPDDPDDPDDEERPA